MTEKKTNYGRRWAVVMIVIILVLPIFTLFFLKKGFEIRANTRASEFILEDATIALPAYSFVSHRGDTITKNRMQYKICIIDFISSSCGITIDAKQRKLFELQQDYYGKTIDFRILSSTLTPQTDGFREMKLLSERYAGRETWHFLRSDDSTSKQLLQFCRINSNSASDTDPFCPSFVYLVDGNGNLRGSYNPLVKEQYDALYNDILYLIDQVDVPEKN